MNGADLIDAMLDGADKCPKCGEYLEASPDEQHASNIEDRSFFCPKGHSDEQN